MFNTGKFAGKTIVISGASRGIGKEIALKLAKDKANIVICAKTAEPHAKLPGTIYTAAEEIEKLGGKALPCIVDVRDEAAVQNAVEEAVKKFGGIDVLVNNASAISLTGTLDTSMKKYDLMNGVNARGTFLMSQKCIPYLKQASNPHILNMSPPLLMEPKWFANHVAYTIAKYGMSMCVLGMHEELRADGIAVNALWPKTTIWTAAMEMLSSGEGEKGSRKPEIVADAAYCILKRSARDYTGNFAIDEDVLKEEGVTDFDKYANDPSHPLMPDFFVPDVDFKPFASGKREKSRAAIKAADVTTVLDSIKKILSPELVQKLGAVYEFTIKVENSTENG
ncbi:Protein DHS-6 [Aphelenchoides avenae]|nr:Protein DHS-6 [Aphelenchus avenae]